MFCILGQPGAIDPTFNPLDSGFWKGNSLNGNVTELCIQKDNKIIIAGYFTRYNEASINRIVRINADGTFDKTFNKVTLGANTIRKIVSQDDGKIIICGDFRSYNGVSRNGIARMNADGSLDTTFDPGTAFGSSFFPGPSAVALQKDGKILVGGTNLKVYNGAAISNIVRINTDGSRDLTFNVGSGFDAGVATIVINKDGRIIAGGSFSKYNGVDANHLACLLEDGSLENNFFAIGAGPNGEVNTMTLESGGKIIIAGNFTSYAGTARAGVARLNTNGSLDYYFTIGTGAAPFISGVNSIRIQNDGKVILKGAFSSFNGHTTTELVRLNTDGTVDASFKSVPGADKGIEAIVLQSDDRLIIGGYFKTYDGTFRNALARINTDGTLDKTIFNVFGLGVNGALWATAVQKDGKIIIGGLFSSYNGKAINNIARLNPDGSLDATFNVGTGTYDWVESIALQSDGKILIGGWFTKYNGIARGGLARLNNDGSLDTTLNSLPGTGPFVEYVNVQQDGKIIISGDFDKYNNVKASGILRLQQNGDIDTTFKFSATDYVLIWKTLVQPDGKIIIAGYFYNLNGTQINNIARLNADGSIDNSFDTGKGTDREINAVGMQSDGKIIIGGNFSEFNGVAINRIARLNTNGNLDNSFKSGAGVDKTVWAMQVQSNDKIILGGVFTTYDGSAANSIVRLKQDGAIDNAFNVGAGSNGIYTIALQPDGKIILGGNFTYYDVTGRNAIARIYGDGTNSINENQSDLFVAVYPNPTNGKFTIESDQPVEISIFDNLGRLVFESKIKSNTETINLAKENSGIYFVRIVSGSKQMTKMVVLNN